MSKPLKHKPSGRFVLRIPPTLHASLREAAQQAGLSLNDFCTRKLAVPLGDPTALSGASAVVERAMAVFGDGLIGMVAYGSWARGEAAAGSDLDVLVVVEASIGITRDLYRRWDEQPVTWNGRAVEPHLVHLPAPDATPSGLWAEVATDGVVLFERTLRISRHLARVRRAIFDGRIVRRIVHGQPYWADGS
ncbi:MAG: toxin-antitoxin system HicB family antitoxin [Candidatus Binatia bacterium]